MTPANFSSILIVVGASLLLIGILWHFTGKYFPSIPLGKLPGDFNVEGKNIHIYFPLTTSLIISILLTLLVLLFRYSRN